VGLGIAASGGRNAGGARHHEGALIFGRQLKLVPIGRFSGEWVLQFSVSLEERTGLLDVLQGANVEMLVENLDQHFEMPLNIQAFPTDIAIPSAVDAMLR